MLNNARLETKIDSFLSRKMEEFPELKALEPKRQQRQARRTAAFFSQNSI